MNAAEMLVKCLENEGVTEIFGIPGEENLAVMDALLQSPIHWRHRPSLSINNE